MRIEKLTRDSFEFHIRYSEVSFSLDFMQVHKRAFYVNFIDFSIAKKVLKVYEA